MSKQKTPKHDHSVGDNFPVFMELSGPQKRALKEKMDDFPGPMNAELAWQLIRKTFEMLNDNKDS